MEFGMRDKRDKDGFDCEVDIKEGDLVKAKAGWFNVFNRRNCKIGIVLKVEAHYFGFNDKVRHRLTIGWTHGQITIETDLYVEVVK
jgi:hypothetical protein